MKEIKIEVPEGYEIDKENSTFETIKFKEKSKLPMSWEELGEIKGHFIDDNAGISPCHTLGANDYSKNTWPTKELAEAALALSQLLQLMDRWNGDWKADWTDDTDKYVIRRYKDSLILEDFAYAARVLAFKSPELCKRFYDTFKDLIETAKPLL